MGGQSYHDLPEWIREGLAVWGSEDVDYPRDTRVVQCRHQRGRSDGDSRWHRGGRNSDNNDYLEGGLAFEWLESRKAGNVKAFCRRLVKGEPYREIWADLGGTELRGGDGARQRTLPPPGEGSARRGL